MKEATGELNMTVVTLVAVAAIGALFYLVIWPLIQSTLVSQTCKTSYGSDYKAFKKDKQEDRNTGNSNAKINQWECCQVVSGKKQAGTCVDTE